LPNKDFNIVKEVQSILQDEFFTPFGGVNEYPILAISHDYISLMFTILGIHPSWIGRKGNIRIVLEENYYNLIEQDNSNICAYFF
jgi:hypothetical protein